MPGAEPPPLLTFAWGTGAANAAGLWDPHAGECLDSALKAASPHALETPVSHLFALLQCYYLCILRTPLKGLLETGK